MLFGQLNYTVIYLHLPDNDQHSGAFFDQDLLRFLITARNDDPVCYIIVFQVILIGHGQYTDLAVEMPFRVIIYDAAADRLGDVFRRSIPQHTVQELCVVERDIGKIRFGDPAQYFLFFIDNCKSLSLLFFHQMD